MRINPNLSHECGPDITATPQTRKILLFFRSMSYNPGMLIFIDDSGDPGFKTDRGSSQALVIALVCFEDNLEAEKTALAIKELRRHLGWSDQGEFKFAKTRKAHKVQFLSTVATFQFRVRSIVFRKERLYSETLRNSTDKFYRYAIKKALDGSKDLLTGANIKIDGHGSREFRQEFETYLRRELKGGDRRPAYAKLAFIKNSATNVLIQLADMCAGSINRSYSDKQDATLYKEILKPRLEKPWEFQ